MASKAAGNTGARNELVSVCDELLRQKFIDKHKYRINVAIIKMLITKRSYKKEYVIGETGIFDHFLIFPYIKNVLFKMSTCNRN